MRENTKIYFLIEPKNRLICKLMMSEKQLMTQERRTRKWRMQDKDGISQLKEKSHKTHSHTYDHKSYMCTIEQ